MGSESQEYEKERAPASSTEAKGKVPLSNIIVDGDKKTWASVASTPPKQEKMTIYPKYLVAEPGFERIVVSPTKFNKKDFDGFVTCTEADLIRKKIKLDQNILYC